MNNMERLQKHFDKFEAKGLFKLQFDIREDVTMDQVDEVSGEIADMFDAIERGDHKPLRLNDSRNRNNDVGPSGHLRVK